MKARIIIFTLICCVYGIAQDENYRSVEEINSVALEAYSEGEYDKAYSEFIKINKSDTAYYPSRIDALFCAIMQKKYDTVITIAHDALALKTLNNPHEMSFYNVLAASHLALEQNDSALYYADLGLKKIPNNAKLHKTRGDAFLALEQIEAAIDAYQTSIRYNPKDYAAHVQLGVICAKRGELTRALLSLNMAAFLNATKDNAINILSYLEQVAKGEVEATEDAVKFPEEEDFSEIDLIIKNKVAFNNKYKVKSKLSFPFIAQNQIMFENLSYDPEDPGFWNQNYVSVFTGMSDAGLLDAYGYYLCSTVEDDNTQKIILKAKKSLGELGEWVGENFTTILNERLVRDGDKHVKNDLFHTGDYGFNMKATFDPKTGEAVGPFTTYHDNGLVSVQGQMKNGIRTGKWTYWSEKGYKTTEYVYDNDKLVSSKSFYPNGAIEVEANYSDGQLNGTKTIYYPFGVPYSVFDLKDGKEEGLGKYYYNTGEVSDEIEVTLGMRNGVSKEYHRSGKLLSELKYTENKPQGPYKAYYENGQVSAEGSYEDGQFVGQWTWYHENGQVLKTGKYEKGSCIGDWIEYDDAGNKMNMSQYGEGGKKTGVYHEYDHDGKLHMELTYKGEEVIGYKFYGPEGNVVAEGEKKKRELEVEGRHPNGNLSMKGNFYKAKKVGLWAYHDFNGLLESHENYNEDGELDGVLKRYFRDGTLETKWIYEDGLKQGKYIDYYRNGNTYRDGWYVDGQPVGEWTTYYINGNIKNSSYYIGGDQNGFFDEYDEKGRLRAQTLYYNGYAQWIEYYDTLGNMESSIDLRGTGSGELELKLQGVVISKFNYKGAKIHGPAEWYELGRLQVEGNYESGNRTGEWKWYNEDKVVVAKGNYKDGDKDGVWEWYYDNGKMSSTGQYKNGEIEGKMTWYNEDGSLETVKNYRSGELHGRCYYYDPTGNLRFSREYDHGALIGYTYLGSDGKEKPLISVNVEDGKVESYFDNGKPSYLATYSKGFLEGDYKKYYRNGQLHVQGFYKKGHLQGEYTSYHPNGKVKFKGTYIDDNLSGPAKRYHANGKLEAEENYYLGNLDGWVKRYDKDGKVTQEVYYLLGEAIKTK